MSKVILTSLGITNENKARYKRKFRKISTAEQVRMEDRLLTMDQIAHVVLAVLEQRNRVWSAQTLYGYVSMFYPKIMKRRFYYVLKALTLSHPQYFLINEANEDSLQK